MQFMPFDFWLTREQNEKHNTLGLKVLINIKVNIVFQPHRAVVKAAGEQQSPTKDSGSSGGPLKSDDPLFPARLIQEKGSSDRKEPTRWLCFSSQIVLPYV